MRPAMRPGRMVPMLNANVRILKQWVPSAIAWGGVAGFAAFYMLERVPFMREKYWQYIPVVGPAYWAPKVEAQKNLDKLLYG